MASSSVEQRCRAIQGHARPRRRATLLGASEASCLGCARGAIQEGTAAIPPPGLDEPADWQKGRPPLARDRHLRARQGQHGRVEDGEAANHRAVGLVRALLSPPIARGRVRGIPLKVGRKFHARAQRTLHRGRLRALVCAPSVRGVLYEELLAPSTQLPASRSRVMPRTHLQAVYQRDY